jgi:hypothetical protein
VLCVLSAQLGGTSFVFCYARVTDRYIHLLVLPSPVSNSGSSTVTRQASVVQNHAGCRQYLVHRIDAVVWCVLFSEFTLALGLKHASSRASCLLCQRLFALLWRTNDCCRDILGCSVSLFCHDSVSPSILYCIALLLNDCWATGGSLGPWPAPSALFHVGSRDP